MDHELWAEALNEISDKHIEEAANPKKKHKITWFGAVASTLAAAMLVVILSPLAFLALFFQGAGSAEPPNDLTGAPTGSADIPFGSTQATTPTTSRIATIAITSLTIYLITYPKAKVQLLYQRAATEKPTSIN